MKTVIEGGTVVAFADGRHQAIEDGVVVFEGSEIAHVGSSYSLPVDRRIDASDRLVIPGLIDLHLHVTDTAYTGSLLVDKGHHDWRDILYKFLPAVRAAVSGEDACIAAECAFAELLLSGATTAVELGYDFEIGDGGNIRHAQQIAKIAGQIGIRCYIGPRYRSMHWGLGEDGNAWYKPYPNGGLSRFHDCVRFCRDYDGLFSNRLRTMLAPGQVDTCDPEILEKTRQTASETGLPIQIHAGQSSQEFREIRRRHNMTTVEYLSQTGLLGSDLIIGHGIYLSEDGDVDSCSTSELALLRNSGTSIAHLPWIQVRQGRFMRSLAKYQRAGINICLGTDTFPFDMVNEMRWAAIMCKVAEQDPTAGTAVEVFNAATLGGAKALNRDDLGRLAPGCKADIVLVDRTKPHALPLSDPFQFMVYSATSADIDTVIVDGELLVRQKKILSCDLPRAVSRLRAAIPRVRKRVRF